MHLWLDVDPDAAASGLLQRLRQALFLHDQPLDLFRHGRLADEGLRTMNRTLYYQLEVSIVPGPRTGFDMSVFSVRSQLHAKRIKRFGRRRLKARDMRGGYHQTLGVPGLVRNPCPPAVSIPRRLE